MKKILASATTLALLGAALPVLAMDNDNSQVTIGVSNSAVVTNVSTASASTGDNSAAGSTGGQGGLGGTINNGGDDVDGSATGNGGNGGNGGLGGEVRTGNASAGTAVANAINTNDIEVARENAPEDMDDDNSVVTIGLTNSLSLTNVDVAAAMTGQNGAAGSTGGNAGGGGDINNGGGEVEDSSTGMGGNGGAGAAGGLVVTGASDSHTDTINVLNTNLIRVRR